MDENKETYSILEIIVTIAAIMIILVLAFFLYYYYTKPIPSSPGISVGVATQEKKPAAQKIVPTTVIKFTASETLPLSKKYPEKSGSCFAGSIAAPFRQDAFRCIVTNSIYDPCFSVTKTGFVYCQVNIDVSTGFLIKLTKALPKPEILQNTQDNWAWYVKLQDGTECSPFTGTRPFFGEGANAQVAFYGCKSSDKNQQIVLLGDLAEGNVWTAREAVLVKTVTAWTIKSTQKVDIDTVWQ